MAEQLDSIIIGGTEYDIGGGGAQVMDDNSSANLNIGDANGNVVAEFKEGHFRTKNFDSRSVINTPLTGKTFSIIGDSISTYKGYVETTDGDGYRAYGNYQPGNANMPTVNDTWWMKVASKTGMILHKNCAWSGSDVCGNSSSTETALAGCSDKRVNDLAKDGVSPDIVLIYMGINDLAHNKVVGTWDGTMTIPSDSTNVQIFSDAYCIMVDKVMKKHPQAKVCCFTLLESKQFGGDSIYPTHNTNGTTLKEFNDKIIEIATSLGANIIDLHSCGINIYNLSTYTIDLLHPNYKGTTLMANKITAELLSKIKF